ncbi:hypothetical protein [Streptomyces alfalfae]|uniref:hypothetical protein n=1 Tax=Streptomyces alfalfae TaxID=1642299 RepID=UPI002811782F|nr:hypothetical protein [Streptomyces alfalfae]
MDFLLALSVSLLVGYAAACGRSGPDAPLWLRWPLPILNRIAHDWRRPAPVPARPDYALIDRLERELGIIEQPKLPALRRPTVCLLKDCAGDTMELETWGGHTWRVHRCEPS